MTRYAFYFDSSSCSGCKTCQVACKDKNHLPLDILWRRVYEVAGGGWARQGDAWISSVFAYNLSIGCNHCDQPICLECCPTNAYSQRPDGIILLDSERCIGCNYCTWVCPYGAPQYDEMAGVMSKCDFCVDRIDAGMPPACVAACPMRALDFGDVDDLIEKYGTTSGVFPLPSQERTGPSLVMTPHQQSHRAAGDSARVNNWEEIPSREQQKSGMKERSLIAFTLLAQLAVGLFVTHLVCLLWFLADAGLDQAIRWCTPGLMAAAGSMVAATATSLFHLGNPRSSWRAASNFRRSWLSREIVLVLAFTGIAVLTAGIAGLRLPLYTLLLALGGLGALVGAGLIYTMSRIYRQRTVPAWNTWQTLAQFVLSSLSMGAAGTTLFLFVNGTIPGPWVIIIGRAMGALLVFSLFLKIVTLTLWLNPADKTGAYKESLTLVTITNRKVLIAYLTLICFAVITGGAMVALSYQDAWPLQTAVLLLTVFLVCAAEYLGRGLFYIARVREGV